jgi:Domain of unknown function (DUF397)
MEHLTWRKSSYSGASKDCVEVAELPATWRKSSFSAQENACVEVADLSGGTAVRDSKDPAGPVLTFTAAQWAVFTHSVRAGTFS